MKEIIEFLVNSITTSGQIEVNQEDSQDGSLNFTIKAPQEEIGRIIGKNGAVIKAIRLVSSISSKNSNKMVRINLASL